MLRQLAVYHQKDPNNLFMVRLAQGLTHLGKGTLTLCPYHSDKALMSPVAVAGLMAVVTACLDVKTCKSSALMETCFFRIFLLNECLFQCGIRRGSYLLALTDCFLLLYLFWSHKVLLTSLKLKVCGNVKNEHTSPITCTSLI